MQLFSAGLCKIPAAIFVMSESGQEEDNKRLRLDSSLTSPPARRFGSTTVLTRAIAFPSPRQTRFLLEQGCDPNQRVGPRQIRPLMVACFISDNQRRMMVFKILLEHGADPVLTDMHGRNSMMYACAVSLKRDVELLIKDCDYDLNAADIYGDTMLHVCAKAGNIEVLRVVLREMLRYRKSISTQNKNYLTPLSLAIMNGHSEAAEMLHQAGGLPRFSPLSFSHVLSMIREHRTELRDAGVRTIADASSVGQAFDAKGYFLRSAEIFSCKPPSKIQFIPRIGKGNSFLPKIEMSIDRNNLLYCRLHSVERDAYVFKFPELADVCRERKEYYYY